MIRHWYNIKIESRPEQVWVDNHRIQQWGINIDIWYDKNHGMQLPLATLNDLKRLRRVINRSIRKLSNEGKQHI